MRSNQTEIIYFNCNIVILLQHNSITIADDCTTFIFYRDIRFITRLRA